MGTIADKLTYLNTIKNNIKNALINKGASISDTDTFASYSDKISALETDVAGIKLANCFAVDDDGTLTRGSGDIVCTASDIGYYGMSNAFQRCTGLTSVSFPQLTTISGNYGMNYAFYGCTGLTSVSFPSLTTISGDYGMNQAFNNCTITSISFPQLTTISSSGMNQAFYGCTGLTSVSFPNLTTISGSSAMYYAFYGTQVTSLDLPKLEGTLPDNTFTYNSGLTKIWLPKEVTTISVTSYYNSPFYNCSKSLVIYTDATEKQEGWSDYCFYVSSSAEATVIYHCTHEDFENETRPVGSLSLTLTVPDGCTFTTTYQGATITDNVISGLFENSNIEVTFTISGYMPITKTYTIGTEDMTETVTIDEFTPVPTSLNLTYPYTDQDDVLASLVDENNFIINSDLSAITSGPSSYNVSSGTSYGYIVVQPTVDTTLSVTGYVSSENSYDYGAVYVGTQIYKPTLTQLKSGTTDSNGSYLFRQSGTSNTSATYTTTLTANTLYYINFCYAKDSSSNKGSDRLIVTDITTTAA